MSCLRLVTPIDLIPDVLPAGELNAEFAVSLDADVIEGDVVGTVGTAGGASRAESE